MHFSVSYYNILDSIICRENPGHLHDRGFLYVHSGVNRVLLVSGLPRCLRCRAGLAGCGPLVSQALAFDCDVLRRFDFLLSFLRNGQGQDAVLELRLDIFLGDLFADIEAALAGAVESFASDVLAIFVLVFLVRVLDGLDDQVAILDLRLNVFRSCRPYPLRRSSSGRCRAHLLCGSALSENHP